MVLNMKELRDLIQMNPGMDFTVNTENGEYQCARRGSPEVAVDTPMGNVLFRSRVLTAIMEELKLTPGNQFLAELCAALKFGSAAAKGAVEEVLDSATLDRVLTMAESYRLQRTQVFEQLNAFESLKQDVKLQELIRNADSATLKMVQRDLVLEAQAVKAEPYYRFLNPLICKEDVYRAVSNLLAMVATISEHPHYDRKGLTEFLSAHRESFCHRAVALMQRDQLNVSRDYRKMIACTVEALNGMQQELRLRNTPRTAEEATRKQLLEAMDLRSKCADPQVLPAALAEIMRHQIATGDAEVVKAYRQGLNSKVTVAVPYLVGQGEQTVWGTDQVRQITETCVREAFAEKSQEKDWNSFWMNCMKVQEADIKRGGRLTLGETTLPKTVKVADIQNAMEGFFELKTHPENIPLAATCAFLGQQAGIITTFIHPAYENVGLSLYDFKGGDSGVENTQMNFFVTRTAEGFDLDMVYNVNQPQHYIDYYNSNLTQCPLDGRVQGNFVNRSQRFSVALEQGRPVIRLPQAGKLHYRLQAYEPPSDFGQVVRDAMDSPTFAKRLQADLKQRLESHPDNATEWKPILESLPKLQALIANQREFLVQRVGSALERNQRAGIPKELGIVRMCGLQLMSNVHPSETPQEV